MKYSITIIIDCDHDDIESKLCAIGDQIANGITLTSEFIIEEFRGSFRREQEVESLLPKQ